MSLHETYRDLTPKNRCVNCKHSTRVPEKRNVVDTHVLSYPALAYLCERNGRVDLVDCRGLPMDEVIENLRKFGENIVSENGICNLYERQ